MLLENIIQKLISKFVGTEGKIPSTNSLIRKSQFETGKQNLEEKIEGFDWKNT